MKLKRLLWLHAVLVLATRVERKKCCRISLLNDTESAF